MTLVFEEAGPNEQDVLTLHCANRLKSGETLASIRSTVISILCGVDASSVARFGPPQIIDTDVLIPFLGGKVDGVNYHGTTIIPTSNPNKVLEIGWMLPCRAP